MILNRLAFYRFYFSKVGMIAPHFIMQRAFTLFHTPTPYIRNEIEKKWLLKAKRFHFETNAHRITGYRWGKEGNPKVVVVHGWTGVATSMHCFIERLVEEGFEVISYDAIGHGESSGKISTLSEWADCLRQVNALFGKVEAILAHSLGAATVIVASKLGLKTKKVVLIAPFCNPKEIIDLWFGKRLSIPAKVLDKLPHYFWERQKEGLVKYGDNWREIFDSSFHVPSLIVYDKEDKEVSQDNVAVCCKIWPWAKFTETKGLGHRRILYDKDVVFNAVSFISA